MRRMARCDGGDGQVQGVLEVVTRRRSRGRVPGAGRVFVACVVMATACAAPVAFPGQTSSAASRQVRWTRSTRIISPVVVATWQAEQRGTEPAQLGLLVLWRGTPGWFQYPGGVSGNGVDGRFDTRIEYGEVRLALSYDPMTQVATINGETVEMAGNNVVFVDDVDVETGPRVVGTWRLEPTMPGSGGQIGQMMQRSPEIMSFLRCDATGSDPRTQPRLARLCLENVGVVP